MVLSPDFQPSHPKSLRLGQLLDVANTTKTAGQVLTWDAATGRWKADSGALGLDARYVNATGDTMTGDLTVRADGAITITQQRNSGDTSGPLIRWGKSRGTAASPTIIVSGDQFGTLRFAGYDGTAYIDGAAISGFSDGAPGTNDMPGALRFFTTPDGSASLAERMRINASGQVLTRGPGSGVTLAALNDTDTGWHWFDGDSLTAYVGNAAVLDLLNSAGSVRMGFFGTAAVAKPTVSGARSNPEAALADLLNELATLGLITNSTTV